MKNSVSSQMKILHEGPTWIDCLIHELGGEEMEKPSSWYFLITFTFIEVENVHVYLVFCF